MFVPDIQRIPPHLLQAVGSPSNAGVGVVRQPQQRPGCWLLLLDQCLDAAGSAVRETRTLLLKLVDGADGGLGVVERRTHTQTVVQLDEGRAQVARLGRCGQGRRCCHRRRCLRRSTVSHGSRGHCRKCSAASRASGRGRTGCVCLVGQAAPPSAAATTRAATASPVCCTGSARAITAAASAGAGAVVGLVDQGGAAAAAVLPRADPGCAGSARAITAASSAGAGAVVGLVDQGEAAAAAAAPSSV
jgi:hypothetical protein